MNPDKKKNTGLANDEVEELLKAAEDAALLKLSVNAHTVHGISSDLHSNSSLQTRGLEHMKRNKKKNVGMVNDEVEELLRAAEDATLLRLNVNAHTVHGSSSDLQPDLNHRFQVLKGGSKATTKMGASTIWAPVPEAAKVKEDEGEDDLFARFAALKASLSKTSSCAISSSADVNTSCNTPGNISKLPGDSLGVVDNIDAEDEDEVEKVIRWAMDAARLDPSPPSDEDDDTKDDDNYDDAEKSDEDDNTVGKLPKDHRK